MLIDMPLEKLKTYKGINPRPSDFDAFWDKSVAEMLNIDPQVEMIPSKFQTDFAECFDLFYTGIGNSRIHAKLLRPKKVSDCKGPAVVQYHGYSGNSGDWNSKLGYVAAGFVVASIDCRGQGGLSQDLTPVCGNTLHGHIIRGVDEESPDKLLFREIFLDCAQLIHIVAAMPEVDEKRIGLMGGSQGGGLTLAAGSLCPFVNRLAPVFPFLSDYRRVWEMDLAKDAYLELKEYFRHFDPRHEREDELFTRLGYIDIHHMTCRIRGKVKMFTGLMDTICPPSTQFAAYNAITSEKDLVIYPDFGHENLPDCQDITFQYMLEML